MVVCKGISGFIFKVFAWCCTRISVMVGINKCPISLGS